MCVTSIMTAPLRYLANMQLPSFDKTAVIFGKTIFYCISFSKCRLSNVVVLPSLRNYFTHVMQGCLNFYLSDLFLIKILGFLRVWHQWVLSCHRVKVP